MPKSHGSTSRNGEVSVRGRYAATVEKGENAWKREWSSFMSGVNLKRLRDGTSGVALKASADIEQLLGELEATPGVKAAAVESSDMGGDAQVNSDGIPLSAAAGHANFSYLFTSPAERRAERDARERAELERRKAQQLEQMAKKDPLSVLSKHQRAMHDAEQRGLLLEGMSRKERRSFLHLTVTEAQKKAEEQAREFKLHDLMDGKIAWYQQGPHPIDLIAEKLVRRKAEKRGKQLGLKYNYLLPHPSWLAKRAQRRRESLLVGLGKRLVFVEARRDNGDGHSAAETETLVVDPLHQRTVPLRDMNLLFDTHISSSPAVRDTTGEDPPAAAPDGAVTGNNGAVGEVEMSGMGSHSTSHPGAGRPASGNSSSKAGLGDRGAFSLQSQSSSSTAPSASMPDVGVLQDPSRIATSFVRRVVRDRCTALAIQQLNRTTNYLSSELVKEPSLHPDDAPLASGLPVKSLSYTAAAAAATSGSPTVGKRSSAVRERRTVPDGKKDKHHTVGRRRRASPGQGDTESR